MKPYDLIVIGAGPAGILAAIFAGRAGQSVLLLEKQSQPGAKLKATGGGRCNLTNTLDQDNFIGRFGRHGRFMLPALNYFNSQALCSFFQEIGVACHAPDGFRVFPVTHSALTVVDALTKALQQSGVTACYNEPVEMILIANQKIVGVTTANRRLLANKVIIATGGLGYPGLGSTGDGLGFAQTAGHKIVEPFPAMLPLYTAETWVKNCRADTVGKVEIRINLPEAKKLWAKGDLIFTKNGIAGPVILDFAREITPLLAKHGKVPLLLKLTKDMNEEELRSRLSEPPPCNTANYLDIAAGKLLPRPLMRELCLLAGIDPALPIRSVAPKRRDRLIKLLAWTPLTVTGHDGFSAAMVTRGGVSLKEICPETLQSKLIKGLFFCGEIVDLDGPCGGFNLQWCFSSGALAGASCDHA